MGTIDKDMTVLKPAPEAASVAAKSESDIQLESVATAINSAANTGQTATIFQEILIPDVEAALVANDYDVKGFGKANKTRPSKISWNKGRTIAEGTYYDEIPGSLNVINLKTLQATMWVQLLPFASNYDVTAIEQLQPTSATIEISDVNKEQSWLSIPTDKLDTSIGQHVYRVDLKHKCIADTCSLYFGYIIQDDDPDKPYVYIND